MRVFVGSGGNDQIHGTKWRDVLIGLEGDDTLIGGNGRDQLWGGPGNDTFVVAPGKVDTIMDFQPGDRIVIDTNLLLENPLVDHNRIDIPRAEEVTYSLGMTLQFDDALHPNWVTGATITNSGELYYQNRLIAEVNGDWRAAHWEFYDHAL